MAEVFWISNWNPIETAPKDGTRILLYFESGDMAVAYRCDNGEWWTFAGFPDSERMWNQHPSHWMPLPEEPTL